MILEEIYNEYVGLSHNQLYQIAKARDPTISRKDVDEFMKSRKSSLENIGKVDDRKGHIFAFSPKMNIQMDLVDMSKYSRQNSGFKWILVIIDVFTRKGYGYPLKNKGEKAVYDALNHFFENEFIPHSITSDNGKEFMNKKVQALFNKHDTNHFTTTSGDHTPLGIVDRFILTLKLKINRYFERQNTVRWVDLFDNFLNSYNNTPHSGILNFKPIEAHKEPYNVNISVENMNKMVRHIKIRDERKKNFNVGDRVRILLRVSKLGRRATEPRYTRGIFIIKELLPNHAILDGVKEKIPLKWLARVPADFIDDVPERNAVNEVNKIMRQTRALQREGLVSNQNETVELRRSMNEPRARRNRYELRRR